MSSTTQIEHFYIIYYNVRILKKLYHLKNLVDCNTDTSIMELIVSQHSDTLNTCAKTWAFENR